MCGRTESQSPSFFIRRRMPLPAYLPAYLPTTLIHRAYFLTRAEPTSLPAYLLSCLPAYLPAYLPIGTKSTCLPPTLLHIPPSLHPIKPTYPDPLQFSPAKPFPAASRTLPMPAFACSSLPIDPSTSLHTCLAVTSLITVAAVYPTSLPAACRFSLPLACLPDP